MMSDVLIRRATRRTELFTGMTASCKVNDNDESREQDDGKKDPDVVGVPHVEKFHSV